MIGDSALIVKYPRGNPIFEGVSFETSADIVIGLISGVAIVRETGEISRYENPLQPEVIDYIRTNKDKLNSWFKEEARRKGIIAGP